MIFITRYYVFYIIYKTFYKKLYTKNDKQRCLGGISPPCTRKQTTHTTKSIYQDNPVPPKAT